MTKEARTHKFSVITECEHNSISFSEHMSQAAWSEKCESIAFVAEKEQVFIATS
jgi:hypothetical protein